jgi:hypothetical protein
MKANKFFAIAFAALTLVGLNACKKDNGGGNDPAPEQETTLTLNPTALTLNVGEEATIAATVEATWTITDETVATVTPANDGGKSANVKALKAGNAIITATTKGGQTKTCVVAVNAGGGGGGGEKTIDAKRIWPVILDGVTSEKYASLIAGDFRPNDVDNNLYIWAAGETYNAGEGTGKNFFGNTEGYMALTVAAPQGWSGAGFNVANAESVAAAKALQAAIAANPDKFFLHIGIKATNAGNHQFYVFNGAEGRSFAIGTATIEAGAVIGDFPRDGEWHEFDVPMAQFATAIAGETIGNDLNILCFLSGAQVGAQLNLDAVYFYEKE